MIFKRAIAALLCLCFITYTPMLYAQQPRKIPENYRVGAGDRIVLSVQERPDLSRELTVDKSGAVILPLVGKIQVAGLTANEMELKILQALKEYYPSVSGLEVRVSEMAGQIVYVLGQVGKPGKYAFSSPPNLWEAIREAGGPTQNASLDNVRIVKDKARGGTSREVNVMRSLEMASIDDLPILEGGDTVVIPEKAAVYTGSFGVNVFGSVLHPGIYRLQAGRDLMSAILLAGGPVRGAALDRIKIIRPMAGGNIETLKIDLNKFLKEGDPASNPQLQPGDTIHIPAQNRVAFLFTNDLGFILNIVTTGVTIAALIVSVQRNRR